MEIHERIRELRKEHLHLSQTAFGERLGVSRSVINNIELNVLAKPEQKLSLMKLMCKEFNVREEWLLKGIEPIFIEPDMLSVDKLMKERGATKLETNIIKAYFLLDSDVRKMLVKHFKEQLIDNDYSEIISENEPNMTVEEAEAEYIKSRLNAAKKTTSSASSITEKNDQKNMSDKVVNE